MSWFARSVVNTLLGGDEDEDEDDSTVAGTTNSADIGGDEQNVEEKQPGTPSRGVKEDLSELSQTFTSQLWGVASFLAPPPTTSPSSTSPPLATGSPTSPAAETPRTEGIRKDLTEFGGRVRSGISMLSSNKAMTEISKIASMLLPFDEEEDIFEEADYDYSKFGSEIGAIGVTEEVLAFARNISMHPETWLDFPLLPDNDDAEDFGISHAQQEHALTIERLAPRLAALKTELCPSRMSEGCFWKIYFVLLHPRLNQDDVELLSTPQIVEARSKLQGLQSRSRQGSERIGGSIGSRKEMLTPMQSAEHSKTIPIDIASPKSAREGPISVPITDVESEKHPVVTGEVKIIDKSVTEEEPPVQAKDKESCITSKMPIENFDDEGEYWLGQDSTEVAGSASTRIQLGNEEDVSFSDLEDDDDETAPKISKSQGKELKD